MSEQGSQIKEWYLTGEFDDPADAAFAREYICRRWSVQATINDNNQVRVEFDDMDSMMAVFDALLPIFPYPVFTANGPYNWPTMD